MAERRWCNTILNSPAKSAASVRWMCCIITKSLTVTTGSTSVPGLRASQIGVCQDGRMPILLQTSTGE